MFKSDKNKWYFVRQVWSIQWYILYLTGVPVCYGGQLTAGIRAVGDWSSITQTGADNSIPRHTYSTCYRYVSSQTSDWHQGKHLQVDNM